MSTSNTIKITKCDNQLVIYAIDVVSSPTQNSYEICNIKSGYNNAVDVNITISQGDAASAPVTGNGVDQPLNIANGEVTLPAGQYALVYTGLNWGGPYQFEMEFNGQPQSLPYSSGGKNGAVWNLGNMDLTFEV